MQSAGLAAAIVLPLLGLGWAILRFELSRYAAAHPSSPLVQDAKKIMADGKAVASALGVTPAGAAAVLSGYLSDHGLPATASALLADAQRAAAVAAAVTPALAITPRLQGGAVPAPGSK